MKADISPPLPEVWKRYYTEKDETAVVLYYASNLGRVMSVNKKTGAKTIMKLQVRKNKVTVYLRNERLVVARVVWEAFNGPIPNGYVIFHKNKLISDNELINLEMITLEEHGRRTGFRSRSRPVYCADNDTYYRSINEASKALYCSNTAISRICNGECKSPMYNIWYSDEVKAVGRKRTQPRTAGRR